MSSPIPVGLLCLVFLVGLICLLSVPPYAQAQPEISLGEKKVLILHSFERSMPINEVTDQGIGETLNASGIPVKNQFFEYLDLVSDRGSEYRKHHLR